ncbi:aryl hydrocarbon receptor 1b isoform X2 [Simochromis diagramma]|uniref:aryl hydrocarbon receptor 1b isoform X2 n=1 Tax=Simochromis diagramma TaxID=43689 RepID=UPI001A7E78A5|nr:aryl hydrocarbon receptor 1b isoform X2 [Simochromis diagramma]
MYAGRKRRKPAQKGVKPPPIEGAKSNPSKRHRDRLNSELDQLASLLPFPEDVISSLDKLSILRLSVSYLRTKSFFSVALKNRLSSGTNRSSDHKNASKTTGATEIQIPEGELLLQTDVMHQSVFELIHTDDQQEFKRNLHWALNPPVSLEPPTDPPDGKSVSTSSCLVSYNPEQLPPENSSFLERSFVCRFRCLLDNSFGFLALNIQGRLKFLHGQSRQQCDSDRTTPPQLALFAIATPLQPPAILEIRTRNMIFRTKHKLDFTPMACDAKGKIVLGYTEAELRVRGSGYQFIHAADMLYCAENHVRMIKTGESGLTVFRLLTKDNRWKWVQANARLIYKNGKPDYIIATQRPLADEEGGEHLRKRSMHLPFTFATGEALLYQTGYPLHGFSDPLQGKARGSKSKKSKGEKGSSDELDPKSLLGALMSQDESVYVCQPDTEPKVSYHGTLFSEQQSRADGLGALFSGDSWYVVSSEESPGERNGKTSSFDPLLTTLDSLSLDGEETCSNSELFSALENLGLNAEDLERLLLDERMMHVELDPDHIPTLSDLLTNNEILSYIHDSLEGASERQEQVNTGRFGSSNHQSNSDSAQSVSQQVCLTAGPVTGRPDSHWVVRTGNHHNRHHTNDNKATELDSKHANAPQWQLQQEQLSAPLQYLQVSNESTLLSGFQNNPHGPTLNGSCIPNGLSAFPPSVVAGHQHYSVSGTDGAVLNDSTLQEVCQSLVSTVQPYQLLGHHKQEQTEELEQLLVLTQPPHSVPSLETYGVFAATQDSTHSKLENGCLLGAASTAYVTTCLMSNGNAVATGDIPVPCPDELPALQDSQKSGFFL